MIISQRIDEAELSLLNRRLVDYYGRIENLPAFRVVWSEDQLEKRLVYYTKEGLALLRPEMQEVPKYRQYIQNKYVLEGLTVVPQVQQKELTTPLSYEPIWVFEKDGQAVYPAWGAVKFVLDTLKKQMSGEGQTKYKDPESNPEESAYIRKMELDKLQQEMFGNESAVADALAYKEGIVVPGGTNGN